MTQIRHHQCEALDKIHEHESYARLWAWRDTINALIEKYGEDASMFIDSGSNDAQLVIEVFEDK